MDTQTAGELAPRGRLRAALNFGNKLLVHRLEDGSPAGMTVDLAHKLAERAGLALDLEAYGKAGDVTDAMGQWDICFLAADPKRDAAIVFSRPYVTIEGHFIVRRDCPAHAPEDVDKLGLTIAVVRGSAYGLHLERNARGAQVAIYETAQQANAAFASGEAQVIVGLSLAAAQARANADRLRVLRLPFMSIAQTIGVPAGRPAAARFVSETLDDLFANGFIDSTKSRHGLATG